MTIDCIRGYNIYQPKDGFRFGTDSVSLAWFATVKKDAIILDIGAGSGIISTLLAKERNAAKITAVEVQENMYTCLEKTIEANALGNVIQPFLQDIKDFKSSIKYDLVISNPPYRPSGIGKEACTESGNIARFHGMLTTDELCIAASKHLKTGGRLALCGDVDLLIDTICCLRKNKFEPKRIQFIHGTENSVSKIFLLEAVYGGGVELKVEPPILQTGSTYKKIFNGSWNK